MVFFLFPGSGDLDSRREQARKFMEGV